MEYGTGDVLAISSYHISLHSVSCDIYNPSRLSRDIGTALWVSERLRAGTVWVNCYNVFSPGMPFGGYGISGWGREVGAEAMDNYLETKCICVAVDKRE